jgi:hypothetical protein
MIINHDRIIKSMIYFIIGQYFDDAFLQFFHLILHQINIQLCIISAHYFSYVDEIKRTFSNISVKLAKY